MACNCATKEQLAYLYEKYGHKVEVSGPKTLAFKVKKFFVDAGVVISMIFVIPMLFAYVLKVETTKDKKINLMEFFKLQKAA